VQASPRDERARLALADVLTTAGRLDEAERVLLETVDVLPASGLGWYRLGRLYHTREQYPEAVAALERAAALETLGGLDAVYQVIGLVQTLQQNGGEAVAAYRRQAAINPNDPGAHRALGDAWRDVDRDDEAATGIWPHSSSIQPMHRRSPRWRRAISSASDARTPSRPPAAP
jgi:tetratricopeptide (TPR) repeat protein